MCRPSNIRRGILWTRKKRRIKERKLRYQKMTENVRHKHGVKRVIKFDAPLESHPAKLEKGE
jgi:hypothetical protein